MNQDKLKDVLKSRLVIVGVGNILRGDDGFGPAVIRAIEKKINALCIDAGTTPENHIKKIASYRPDVVLIIDAVDMDANPGDCDLLTREEILTAGFTTHDISPKLFIEYLENETNAQVYMLGIQPKQLDLGSEISDTINNKVIELAEAIIREKGIREKP